MRLLIFSLLLHANISYANFEEDYIGLAVLINTSILMIVPIINFIQFNMHYNLNFHGGYKNHFFYSITLISVLSNELYLLSKDKKRAEPNNSAELIRPKTIKSNFAYGIVLETQLLSEILFHHKDDQDCIKLLSEAIIYPVSVSDHLKLSVTLRGASLRENLRHLDLRYGNEEYSWFETLCLTDEEIEPKTKVLSIFSRDILMDVCMRLQLEPSSTHDEHLPLENISEYNQSIITGKGVSNFLAIDTGNKSENSSLFVFCNSKDRVLELYNSHEPFNESVLQEYIINLHIKEINSPDYKAFLYVVGVSIGMAIFNTAISCFIDVVIFYSHVEDCPICYREIPYPGSLACGYHWFCTSCLMNARIIHPRKCPMCGV